MYDLGEYQHDPPRQCWADSPLFGQDSAIQPVVYSGEPARGAFFPANLSGDPWNKHASTIAAGRKLVKADHIRRVMGHFYKTNLFPALKKKRMADLISLRMSFRR